MKKPTALILIGPQGGGKTTIVADLKMKGFAAFGMSDAILERTAMNPNFAARYPRSAFYDVGVLYPDNAVAEAFFARVTNAGGSSVVLDGCTRSVGQVDMVVPHMREEGYNVIAIELICSLEVCKERIARRVAYCKAHDIPVRPDDEDVNAIEQRLKRYFEDVTAVTQRIKHLGVPFASIDTEVPVEMVLAQAQQHLSRACSCVCT